MDVREALKRLESLGTAQNRKVYARHGVQEPCFGVSYANQGKLAKQIGTDHALALSLWSSGNHDARILATAVADPERLDRRTLEEWVKQCDSYVIADALSSIAARSREAKVCGLAWARSGLEFVGACGWNVIGILAARSAHLSDEECLRLLVQIEQGIHAAPNRTRHSMNQALISIGSRPTLTGSAIAAADRIGVVDVDHGETSCKTPDARSYIEKMVAYHRARAERNGEPWPPPVPGRKRGTRRKSAAPSTRTSSRASAKEPADTPGAGGGPKAATREAAPKAAPVRKGTASRKAPGKQAGMGKVGGKPVAAKKVAAKKATADRPAAKKASPKKSAPGAAVAKKASTKKSAPKKTTSATAAKKAPTRKAPARSSASGKRATQRA